MVLKKRSYKKMIKLMKSTFYNEQETKNKLCEFIFNSDILSMNKVCKNFETKFSQFQGRRYSVLFNSGSSANLALIQALINKGDLKKGDKVSFSALTWATNVMPLIQLNLSPVPIDISIKNLNITSKELLEKIEDEDDIKALFLTNLLGFCGDIDRISSICKEKNILLIEDNCESFGSEYNHKKLGNFGDASTFSFFVGHHISTIEGGMVCTDNKELYKHLLMVRAHGWARDLDKEDSEKLRKEFNILEFHNRYTFYNLGYNLRPTEITGFLGLNQLEFANEIIKKREENFKNFKEIADKNEDIERLDINNQNVISNFAYPLIFKDENILQKYIKKFSEAGIEIRPIVGGSIISQPFFKDYFINRSKNNLKNAEKAHNLGFYFPNNPELTEEEIEIIKGVLK